MKVNFSLKDHMAAVDRANGSHRNVFTEGNVEDRHSRSTGASVAYGSRQSTQDSPIKRLQNDSNTQRNARSISALNPQRSSPITQRDDVVGSIHSPNFAQNIEMISSRFDSFRNTNCEEQISKHSSAQNIRMAIDSKSNYGSNQLTNSRVNQMIPHVSQQQQQASKKKIFDASAQLLATRMSNNNNNGAQQSSSLMGLTKQKISPLLSSSRLHLHSNSNKENVNKGNHNNGSNSFDDQYSSVTSISMKETDLEKANERIRYLDMNLRREMLNSEEQRSAMSILKQELERKLHEFGFMNFFKTNNTSPNLSHIDIYMELQVENITLITHFHVILNTFQVIKKKLLEKEEKISHLTKEKEPFLREQNEFRERNRQLEIENEQIRMKLDALKSDSEDIEDLRAEKVNLIEFVEKIKSENERLEDEYVAIKTELTKTKKSQMNQSSVEDRRRATVEEELREQIDYISEELTTKNQELEDVSDQLKQEISLREQAESQRKSLLSSNEELQEQLTSVILKHASLESQLEETTNYRSGLKSDNEELKNQLESVETQTENMKSEVKTLKTTIEQLKLQNSGLTETIKMQGEQILGWKHSSQTSTFLQTQFESYQQKFEDAKDNIFTLTQTLEETNAELQKVAAKCHNFELIAEEKAHIIVEKEKEIDSLHQTIKGQDKEFQELKRRIQEDSKDKYLSQYNTEKRSITLQLDHLKSQNALLERKLQEVEMMNERLRFDLEERHIVNDEILVNENAKVKYEQNIAFYEKKIKELKLQSMGRRQEQISLSVQIGLAGDIVKQLQQYIRGNEDFELTQIVEDLEFQIEEITGLVSPNHNSLLHQQSSSSGHNSIGSTSLGSTHRNLNVNNHSSNGGSYQYSSRHNNQNQMIMGNNYQQPQQQQQQQSHMTPSNAAALSYTPQHAAQSSSMLPTRSKEIEDLKNILSIKDREIQQLKSENTVEQHLSYGGGYSQQQSTQSVSRYERNYPRHNNNEQQSSQSSYMHPGLLPLNNQLQNCASGGVIGGYYSGKQNLKSYFN